MRQTKSGYILYDKIEKIFTDDDGDSEQELIKAHIFRTNEEAKRELSRYDEPEHYEIWEVEISIQTK